MLNYLTQKVKLRYEGQSNKKSRERGFQRKFGNQIFRPPPKKTTKNKKTSKLWGELLIHNVRIKMKYDITGTYDTYHKDIYV